MRLRPPPYALRPPPSALSRSRGRPPPPAPPLPAPRSPPSALRPLPGASAAAGAGLSRSPWSGRPPPARGRRIPRPIPPASPLAAGARGHRRDRTLGLGPGNENDSDDGKAGAAAAGVLVVKGGSFCGGLRLACAPMSLEAREGCEPPFPLDSLSDDALATVLRFVPVERLVVLSQVSAGKATTFTFVFVVRPDAGLWGHGLHASSPPFRNHAWPGLP